MKKLLFLLFLSAPASAVDVTFTIPDAIAPRVTAGFCKVHGYVPIIEGEPNPETCAQFTRRKIIQYLRDMAVQGEMVDVEATADSSLGQTRIQKYQELNF